MQEIEDKLNLLKIIIEQNFMMYRDGTGRKQVKEVISR